MKINSELYRSIHKSTIHSYKKWYFIDVLISTGVVFCKECGKLSYSGYGYCDDHARKHRKREQYHRKRMVDLTSAEILVGNLEVNENDTTCH
ncbi:unnamed protein product [Rhizophagus irregularis]|nr:unnamed protein product [Rhizophagus irregularis]